MRFIMTAVVFAALTPAGLAHAQVKNVDGASAAGLCASALEFVAGARAGAGIAQPRELQRLGATRDTLLALPQFAPGEVEAYAKAWSERMGKNMAEATSDRHRAAIGEEIAGIARGCHQDMVAEINALNQQGVSVPRNIAPASPQVVQPGVTQPLQSQPLQSQPLQTQPMPVQPLQTQPLFIDPQ